MADDIADPLPAGRDLLREVAAPLGTWPAFASPDASPPEPIRRRALLGVIDATKDRLVSTTRNFARKALRGIPTLGPWARDFAAALGAGHMAGLMAAAGTTDPAPADVAVVIGNVRKQAGFLAKFRKAIAKGAVVLGSLVGANGVAIPPNTPGKDRPVAARVLDRAAMYADAIWGGTAGVLRARMIRDGYDEERRVLGGSEHPCPQCPELAAKGWRPVGTLPGIGETVCHVRCRCSFEYRHRETGRVEVPIGPHDPPRATAALGPVHNTDNPDIADNAQVSPSKTRPTDPAAPKYGRSSAVAGYEDGVDPASSEAFAVRQRAKDVLGLRSAKDAMARISSLVGAPDDARVVVRTLGDDMIRVDVQHADFHADRTIYRHEGELSIENSSFMVDADAQNKGLGARVFGRQVEQAAAMGATRLVAEAARGRNMNGYYTWARFGYDAPIPADVRPDLPPALRDLARVSDLMRTAEGRAAWKEHGVSTEMEFDLRDGSLSRKVWDAYRAEKAAKEGQE